MDIIDMQDRLLDTGFMKESNIYRQEKASNKNRQYGVRFAEIEL